MSNPYDQNPYGQTGPANPYVQASPYGVPMAQNHPQSVVVLVLGILSVVGVAICGPIAWYLGNKAIAEVDANPMAYSDRGTLNAGRIMGIIGTVLLALGVLLFVGYILFVVLIMGSVLATGG